MARERLGDYPLANFEKEHLAPQQLTLDDFVRFLRTEAGIQQLVGAAAVSAKLVSPREAEILYRKGHEEIAVEVASFWATNYLERVTITNEAVARFYTNRMAAYRVPERAVVSYVEFAATNFFADADKPGEITNLTSLLDEAYFSSRGNQSVQRHQWRAAAGGQEKSQENAAGWPCAGARKARIFGTS
jgi:hypothetical protein